MSEHDHEHAQLHEDGTVHEHTHGTEAAAHEHEHSHEHCHEHVHADGTVHSHAHSHTHTHPHSHEAAEAFENPDQALALMAYMLDHNRHHAEELHELCHKLAAGGKEEAAELLHAAVDKFSEGNDLLESALKKMKQE